MLNNIKYFLIIVLSISTSLQPIEKSAYKQIIQISIPKCGTWLLNKCIHLLTGRKQVGWSDKINEDYVPQYLYNPSMNALQNLTNLPETEFWMTHLFYSKEHVD